MDVVTFQLPEDAPDIVEALRAAEPQAPKQIKPVLLQAANELCDFRRVAADAVRELREAAELRAGAMDSHSRADEVSRYVRATISGVASRLQHLLGEK